MTSSVSRQVRLVIELFCSILEENKIVTVRAEALRQAKFNNDAVTEQVAWVLLRVIHFCENKHVAANDCCSESKGEILSYIKSRLQAWGYLCRSVSALPDDLSHGSRALLLALGWVIHTQKLTDKIIHRRKNPLHQTLFNFCQKQTQACESSASTQRDILQLAQKTSPQEKIQQQMMLAGKLRMAMRRLYSVILQKANLVHTIESCTSGVSLQSHLDHLTPLEVQLLRFPSSMKQILQELEQDNEELRHLLEWREKGNVFWDWMDSVLVLHHQEKAQTAITPKTDVEEVYLPLPITYGEELITARSNLRDFILSHESEMDRLEQLVLRKKISEVEMEMACMHVDQEMNGLAYILRDCGRGPDMNDGSKRENGQAEPAFSSSLSNYPEPCRWAERQRVTMKSDKAVKADRKSQVVEAANKEISRLKETTDSLEQELKQRQVLHMQELQQVLNNDERFICIQPRCIKHLFS